MESGQRIGARVGIAVLMIALVGWSASTASRAAGAVQEEVRLSKLFPFSTRGDEFRVTSGEDPSERISAELVRLTRERERWELSIGEARVVLGRNEPGALLAHVVQALGGRTLRYRDPVRVLPARLSAGESLRDQGSVVIVEEDGSTREGTYTHRLIEASRVRFAILDRPIGWLVELEHRIDLDMAEVRVRLDVGLVPGRGLVYWDAKSTIDKLGGLFGSTDVHSARMVD